MAFRALLRILGILIFACGFLCLPASPGAHPYSLTTGFSHLGESGGLLSLATVLMIIGAVFFALSFIQGSDA
jgi:predicted MFS family arabinose efflux permease